MITARGTKIVGRETLEGGKIRRPNVFLGKQMGRTKPGKVGDCQEVKDQFLMDGIEV